MEPAEGGVDRLKRTPDERGDGDNPPSRKSEAGRLSGLYPKPLEGERVPISFIASEKKRIGWSPQEGRSVRIDAGTDLSTLKRVREINEVRVFNWLTGREGLIELSDGEMDRLLAVLDTKNGEKLVYTRVKVKGRLLASFALEEDREPRRWLLSERIDD